MKLADVFYFSRIKPETEEQKKERESRYKLHRRKKLADQILEAQIAREKASKLKDFKQYMFGEFVSRVNILKLGPGARDDRPGRAQGVGRPSLKIRRAFVCKSSSENNRAEGFLDSRRIGWGQRVD